MVAEQVAQEVVAIVVLQTVKLILISIIPVLTVTHVNITAQDVLENVAEHVQLHGRVVHILYKTV